MPEHRTQPLRAVEAREPAPPQVRPSWPPGAATASVTTGPKGGDLRRGSIAALDAAAPASFLATRDHVRSLPADLVESVPALHDRNTIATSLRSAPPNQCADRRANRRQLAAYVAITLTLATTLLELPQLLLLSLLPAHHPTTSETVLRGPAVPGGHRGRNEVPVPAASLPAARHPFAGGDPLPAAGERAYTAVELLRDDGATALLKSEESAKGGRRGNAWPAAAHFSGGR